MAIQVTELWDVTVVRTLSVFCVGGAACFFPAAQGEVDVSDAAIFGGVCGLLWPAYASCYFKGGVFFNHIVNNQIEYLDMVISD